jgi:8-oxo-dGTP diphosphatase
MTKYVLGFAFNDVFVLLIEKKRPKWQYKRLNGIGGHIEENEAPIDAMVREFREETGIHTTVSQWEEFALMRGPDWECVCFRSRNEFDIGYARQMTDERPIAVNKNTLGLYPVLSNVPWLIGLALDNSLPNKPVFTY